MFCQKCGHQMEETAGYCPKCGTATGNTGKAPVSMKQDNKISVLDYILGGVFLVLGIIWLVKSAEIVADASFRRFTLRRLFDCLDGLFGFFACGGMAGASLAFFGLREKNSDRDSYYGHCAGALAGGAVTALLCVLFYGETFGSLGWVSLGLCVFAIIMIRVEKNQTNSTYMPDGSNYRPSIIRKSNPTTVKDGWKCKHCGTVNPGYKLDCKNCGKYR